MISNSKYVNAFKKCPKILKIANACFDSFFFYLKFSTQDFYIFFANSKTMSMNLINILLIYKNVCLFRKTSCVSKNVCEFAKKI